jgi:uncharacterized membrane protein
VSTYDWLLFLHLLGAVAVAGALVFFTAVLVGTLRSETASDAAAYLRLTRTGGRLFDLGGALLLAFGIWLVLEADYSFSEAWIIAALVLFAVASFAGTRTRDRCLAALREGVDARAFLRERRVALLYALTVVSIVALLADMIFKPGAG